MAQTTVATNDRSNNLVTLLAGSDGSSNVAPAHVLYDVNGSPFATSANPGRLSSPIVTPVAAGTLTITTGGTAQTLFAAGTITNGYRVRNPSTAIENIIIDDSGATASMTSAGAVEIPPGSVYESAFPVTTAVSILAATTAHAFSAVRF